MSSEAYAGEIILDDYVKGLNPAWEKKSFAGDTQYRTTKEDNRLCIRALSRSSASALIYRIEYDPKEFPILTWMWKVRNVLKNGDAHLKDGDDYAARVYVVFHSRFIWKTTAINYIWANKLPVGVAIPNPFVASSIMVAVESGPGQAGIWKEERRNIYEDYQKYFGKEPPDTDAIAIMTDTDNTGEEAIAWYGPIRILSDSSN